MGQWVTLDDGQHVYIDKGQVLAKGPGSSPMHAAASGHHIQTLRQQAETARAVKGTPAERAKKLVIKARETAMKQSKRHGVGRYSPETIALKGRKYDTYKNDLGQTKIIMTSKQSSVAMKVIQGRANNSAGRALRLGRISGT